MRVGVAVVLLIVMFGHGRESGPSNHPSYPVEGDPPLSRGIGPLLVVIVVIPGRDLVKGLVRISDAKVRSGLLGPLAGQDGDWGHMSVKGVLRHQEEKTTYP